MVNETMPHCTNSACLLAFTQQYLVLRGLQEKEQQKQIEEEEGQQERSSWQNELDGLERGLVAKHDRCL
jgi:hypothetical protein